MAPGESQLWVVFGALFASFRPNPIGLYSKRVYTEYSKGVISFMCELHGQVAPIGPDLPLAKRALKTPHSRVFEHQN